MKQVKLFLTCYAIIIAIIIIVEVAFTIYFVVFQSKFKDQFVPKLTDSLQATYEGPLGLTPYGNKKPSPVSLAWDFIMYNVSVLNVTFSLRRLVDLFLSFLQFKCCGVQKPEDFYAAKAWNRTNPWQMTSPSPFSVPLTCCSAISGEQNWNDLPLDKLKAAEACAVTGVGHPDLYKTVSRSTRRSHEDFASRPRAVTTNWSICWIRRRFGSSSLPWSFSSSR